MAISGDYPHPITVNTYICHNCTDVDRAKRGIDPAHPESGPFGVNDSKATKHKPSGASEADSAQLAMLHALNPTGGSGAPGRLVNLMI